MEMISSALSLRTARDACWERIYEDNIIMTIQNWRKTKKHATSNVVTGGGNSLYHYCNIT
jgi:hypothetical protein